MSSFLYSDIKSNEERLKERNSKIVEMNINNNKWKKGIFHSMIGLWNS